MKSSLLVLFTFAFGLAACAPTESVTDDIDKQDKAVEECNALFPDPKYPKSDSRARVMLQVIAGKTLDLKNNAVLGCNLNCVLQRIGFFDEASNMRAPAVFMYNIRNNGPELAAYAEVFAVNLFQTYRTTKDMEDKCQKAYLTFYRFVETVFSLSLAYDMHNDLNVKEIVLNSTKSGEPLPNAIQSKMINYFKDLTGDIKLGLEVIQAINNNELPPQLSFSTPSSVTSNPSVQAITGPAQAPIKIVPAAPA